MAKKTRRRKFKTWPKCVLALLILVCVVGIIRRCTKSDNAEEKAEERISKLPHLNEILNNDLSTSAETKEMDVTIEKFLKRWELVGAQIAVSRNDSLIYAKGFGWAEKEKSITMQPGNIMRIASVSKLITAVGIMKLQEMGKLRLSDKVFGVQGILKDTTYINVIKDKRYFNITVEDLLRHRAGFTNRWGDPLFSTRYVMMQNRLQTPPDHKTLLRIVLKRPLCYEPGGDMQKYCNIGYMLLSMIIEQKSGMSYERFMQEMVLQPAGCFDFHIAGNYYKDKRPNETKYYMHKEAQPIPEFNNSGRMVVKCYGENNIPELQGAGAWVASAAELCHFISAIDGDDHYPDVISKQSVEAMTEDKGNHYSLGWNRTPKNDKPWSRTGTLSGTSALVIRFPDTKQCWVLITNNSTWKGQGFAHDTLALFEKLRKKYGESLKPLKVDFMKADNTL